MARSGSGVWYRSLTSMLIEPFCAGRVNAREAGMAARLSIIATVGRGPRGVLLGGLVSGRVVGDGLVGDVGDVGVTGRVGRAGLDGGLDLVASGALGPLGVLLRTSGAVS